LLVKGRVLIAGLVLALVAALIAAFSPPTAAQRIEAQFWHAMGGRLGEVVQELVDRFNESQDQYRITAVFRGNYSETMTAAIAAYRARNHPHIVQVFEVGTQTMLMSGAVYPVYQLMADYGYEIDWNDFVPPVLSYYATADGNLYSMPFNSSTPVLYYNKTAFAQAGLDPERPPETWQEVEEFSRRLIQSGAAECGFTIGWPSWTMIESTRAWHGLPFATHENGYTSLDAQLVINDEFTVNHIDRLARWQSERIFRYGGRGGDAEPLFINGQCAMIIQSSAAQGGFRSAINRFEWATAMLPHYGGEYPKVNSVIGGATLWVMAGKPAREYEAVAAFLKFLSEPEQQAYWHKETGYVPISRSAQALLEAEGYLDQNPDQRTAYSQLTYSPPTPETRGIRLGNFVQIRDVIEEELENIFRGQKTAKQGLDDAVRRSNQLLREFASLYQ